MKLGFRPAPPAPLAHGTTPGPRRKVIAALAVRLKKEGLSVRSYEDDGISLSDIRNFCYRFSPEKKDERGRALDEWFAAMGPERVKAAKWLRSVARKLPTVAIELNGLAADFEAQASLLARPPHRVPNSRHRQFRRQWDSFTRSITRPKKLTRDRSFLLGCGLFNAVFDKDVTVETFERQTKLDQQVKKAPR